MTAETRVNCVLFNSSARFRRPGGLHSISRSLCAQTPDTSVNCKCFKLACAFSPAGRAACSISCPVCAQMTDTSVTCMFVQLVCTFSPAGRAACSMSRPLCPDAIHEMFYSTRLRVFAGRAGCMFHFAPTVRPDARHECKLFVFQPVCVFSPASWAACSISRPLYAQTPDTSVNCMFFHLMCAFSPAGRAACSISRPLCARRQTRV
jgi:hypothetical protein